MMMPKVFYMDEAFHERMTTMSETGQAVGWKRIILRNLKAAMLTSLSLAGSFSSCLATTQFEHFKCA